MRLRLLSESGGDLRSCLFDVVRKVDKTDSYYGDAEVDELVSVLPECLFELMSEEVPEDGGWSNEHSHGLFNWDELPGMRGLIVSDAASDDPFGEVSDSYGGGEVMSINVFVPKGSAAAKYANEMQAHNGAYVWLFAIEVSDDGRVGGTTHYDTYGQDARNAAAEVILRRACGE